MCVCVCIYIYIYIYIYTQVLSTIIVAIFYPFSQFCEIDSSLLSLRKQPNTAPNLFQRGVEYGKYDDGAGLAAVGGLEGRPVRSVAQGEAPLNAELARLRLLVAEKWGHH